MANSTFASPSFVLDDPGGEDTGTPLVMYPASGGYPGEDFAVSDDGLLANFYQAGLVSEGVAEHYG